MSDREFTDAVDDCAAALRDVAEDYDATVVAVAMHRLGSDLAAESPRVGSVRHWTTQKPLTRVACSVCDFERLTDDWEEAKRLASDHSDTASTDDEHHTTTAASPDSGWFR